MPAIVATSTLDPGVRASTRTTLTATGNPFTYSPGQGGFLILHNPTAGALSPVITGSAAVAQVVNQVGLSVNFAAGYAVGSIAVGAQVLIPLASIDPYLRGTIDITSGTGLVATHLTT
jgi:hypothetical protein